MIKLEKHKTWKMKNKSIFVLTIIVISLIACSSKNDEKYQKRVLPIIGNYDIEYKTVDGKEVADTVYPKMIDFTFLNQDSLVRTKNELEGKIWIADFFFTTCPTICPIMTKNMKWLNEQTKDLTNHIQFLSFTINPKRDTPTQLRNYKKHHQIESTNWDFLTGEENFTHQLGINHFQIFAGEDASAAGGYAHSGAFTLVDKEGYVRGVYLGTELEQVKQLEKDLRKLIQYEYNGSSSN